MQIDLIVRNVLELYAEGGTVKEHLNTHNIKHGHFYAYLRANPEVKSTYHDIQESRADMMVDETYGLDCSDPRAARVKADIRLKIAALYDRRRFGDRIDLNVTGQVDITGALTEAQTRSLRPMRDLANVSDAQVNESTLTLSSRRTDSGTVSRDADDIFAD